MTEYNHLRKPGRPRVIDEATTPINFYLTESLIAKVDARKGNFSRSHWMRCVLEAALLDEKTPVISAEIRMQRERIAELEKKIADLEAEDSGGASSVEKLSDVNKAAYEMQVVSDVKWAGCFNPAKDPQCRQWWDFAPVRAKIYKTKCGLKITPAEFVALVSQHPEFKGVKP